MFCENCGNQMNETAKFCPKCGHGLETAAPVPPIQPVPVVSPEPPAGSVSVKGTVTAGNKGTAPSIIFTVLMVLLGVWCSVIFLVRHVTGENVIDSVVKETDLSRLEVGFLAEDEEDLTLAEYISDYADSIFPIPWTKDDVEELLDEKFIRNFAADKVNDYVRDLFHATGEGVIEVKELRKLLEKNENAIYEITGVHLTDEDLDYLVEIIEEEKLLDSTALSEYRKAAPGIFSVIKNVFSYWMVALLLIIELLLVIVMFLVQGRKRKGFLYLGISLFSVGVVDLITSIFIVDSLAEKMNSSLELGRRFWRLLFAPIQEMSILLGIVLAVAGVISGVVYLLTTLVGKGAGKSEKMRAA